MPEPTIATLDGQLLVWREIMLTAINDGDTAGELEAVEELDRLLDIRLHMPAQRTP